MKTTLTATILIAALATSSAALAAVTPEQKCEGGKNDAAGKYAACVGKAEKSYVSSGDNVKYGAALDKCEDKFLSTWGKLETKAVEAAATCPSMDDEMPVQSFLDACSQSVATALAGGPLVADPLTCATALSATNADLGSCTSDLSSTNADLGDCTSDLSSTNADLGVCELEVAALGAEMRCPIGGITGTFAPPVPTPNQDCTVDINEVDIGGAVTGVAYDCDTSPDLPFAGTLTSSTTLFTFEEPSATCGGGRLEYSMIFDTDCDNVTYLFECIAPGPFVVYSETGPLVRQ